MKRSCLVGPVVALFVVGCAEQPLPTSLAGTDEGLAPLYLAEVGQGVPDRYIVVMQPEVTSIAGVAAAAGVTPTREFQRARRAFVADLTAREIRALRLDRGVAWVEQDQRYSTSATVQYVGGDGQPWGLDRIDQATRPLSGTYTYSHTAAGVTAYILDTGIRQNHNQFRNGSVSRASNVFDAYGGVGFDCNGHGTHVAGIVGAKTWGVAKAIQLRGIKVLDCDGFGTTSTVLAGLDWLLANFQTPAVANLSLSGGFSKTLNTWVDAVANAGVFVAVAAGNDDDYTCTASPASAVGSFSVAASDSLDRRATFSNWGRCADLYAPGVAIVSTWLNDGLATLDGTSMASPHVAGVAALIMASNGTLPASELARRLIWRGAADRIVDNDPSFYHYGTPNLLLQMGGL